MDNTDPENPVVKYPDLTAPLLGENNTYDEDGNITGTVPMTFEQHPQWLGWARQ